VTQTPLKTATLLPLAGSDALVAAASHIHDIARYAQKAEAFDTLSMLLKEIALLETDIARLRKSRSKSAAINEVALISKIHELKLLMTNIIARHAG
jgi:hypothetical protein